MSASTSSSPRSFPVGIHGSCITFHCFVNFLLLQRFAFILTTLVSYGNLRRHIRIWII